MPSEERDDDQWAGLILPTLSLFLGKQQVLSITNTVFGRASINSSSPNLVL